MPGEFMAGTADPGDTCGPGLCRMSCQAQTLSWNGVESTMASNCNEGKVSKDLSTPGGGHGWGRRHWRLSHHRILRHHQVRGTLRCP
jgi:hypothetical protein